jgi:hypothetical protein
MKILLLAAVAALWVTAATNVVRGAVVPAVAFSASETNFDVNILNNDLIENGSGAVSSVTTTGNVSTYPGNGPTPNSFSNLTDGAASSCCTNGNDLSADSYFDPTALAANPSITYNFAKGMTITSINSIYGWGNTPAYSHQDYQVSLSFAGSPLTFSPLTSVNYDPFASNAAGQNGESSSQVTLTGSSGAIATGVAAIRFTFFDTGGDGQVVREIDVVGSVTPVPESSSIVSLIGLCGMGLAGLVIRRCHKS